MITNLQKGVLYHSMASHIAFLHGTFDVLFYHHIPLRPGFWSNQSLSESLASAGAFGVVVMLLAMFSSAVVI
jgi:hypothetical protein